ncbi:LOW QUALITY PROTEIN: akirin-1-like [Physeter macrocephalus]|uniref:LOW QUALITY PROTEIN: akirin-1-like n=1 Tax=Physeter macrocephalus TaxID=9755 RepID=A0A9W2WN55_PHYMC|nr:LOW QUALITY PROTEIN: akirin-1-like [Physeter catodon]
MLAGYAMKAADDYVTCENPEDTQFTSDMEKWHTKILKELSKNLHDAHGTAQHKEWMVADALKKKFYTWLPVLEPAWLASSAEEREVGPQLTAASAPGAWPFGSTECGTKWKRPMEFEAALLSPGSPNRRRRAPLPGLRPPDAELPPLLQARTPPPTLQQPAPPGSERRLPTAGQIFQNIKQEYSRYQRWRRLEVVLNQSDAFTSESQPHSALTEPSSPGSSWMKKDQPTFTLLRQVGIICERLLKDYEDKIREEYQQILNTKPAEQYESFVKFTHDQIMRRYGTRPTSHVS